MFGDSITFEGVLGATPELRFADSGNAWLKMNVAVSSRKKGKDNAWSDGPTTWLKVKAFGQVAENIAESLQKGDRVVVSGKFETQEWQTREGEDRKDLVVTADLVGVSLRFVPVVVQRNERHMPRGGTDDLVEPF